ncbi:MAG: DNA-directed RNA polymerase subunit beta' [Betaproteobacteria bacterium AqS2]|uniref:DNA-directed RNA polymerase subunit beta' n=1 Tax=Candidatus Amphirhobacter heronislandensis TaxID=1732024 RepID=A0A930UFT2_9GAMM|nr:DNA-directed RNA polymerase subunit beta' [Betaproteobacteria bacterium AqS2]
MDEHTLPSLAAASAASPAFPFFPNQTQDRNSVKGVRLELASPSKIKEWSSGEVRKPETINYRTHKPERDGLFCSVIFGPERDYECLCGKYKAVRFEGIICEKCNVEVVKSSVRRERMGHIELACPVAHIWFVKSLPSRISVVLGMKQRDVEGVLYFEKYVVFDPGRSHYQKGDLLTLQEYREFIENHPDTGLRAVIGAEGLRDLFGEIDVDEEAEDLRSKLAATRAVTKQKELSRRLKIIDQFRRNNIRPEWMILENLPVLPPGLRPLVALEGDRFTSSDLNDLYRRVINRNNRLKKVLELHAPEIIVNNEKRMLQEAVDDLIDGSRRNKVKGAASGRLKSLTDVVKGKTGRFRQNLLGKRVDFSGRTVIVVGPELKLHQCGLPKEMAVELFKPWIYNLLEARGHVTNLRQARRLVEERSPEIWDCLEDAIKQHPVLLNRAPTLHRLGIQAFEPVLIEGRAIQLHPLVCVAFNADFDGDQMAVHVPLSVEAQAEARILMLSSNNMLSSANGNPVILPSQDIVLGLHYLTREANGCRGEGMAFADPEEARRAYESGAVDLHAKCKVRIVPKYRSDEGTVESMPAKILDTTVGRAIMSLSMPPGINLEQFNRTLKKGDLAKLVDSCIRSCDQRATAIFADDLMRLGFKYSTRAGISISIADVVKVPDKEEIIAKAYREVATIEGHYEQGVLSQDEHRNKVSEAWKHAKSAVEHSLMEYFDNEPAYRVDAKGRRVPLKDDQGEALRNPSSNSIYMMVDSGARGSRDQLMQLAGMRGQMVKPDGSIIPTPVIANFREGMNILQYFITTHGGRKGLTDTALKTANSGYLTRRLVDVTQHLVITEEDCKTSAGIALRQESYSSGVTVSLGTRALGRVLAQPVKDPRSGAELLATGTEIDERSADMLDEYKISEIKVRSAVTCEAQVGLCVKCYGRDLGRGQTVQVGEAVGVIAAQSIGEPGTQLTLRTFHTGGVSKRTKERYNVAKDYGAAKAVARLEHIRTIKNSKGEEVVVSNNGEIAIEDEHGQELDVFEVPYGGTIFVKDGDPVKSGQQLSEQDPFNVREICLHDGYVRLENMGPEVLLESQERRTGKTTFKIDTSRLATKKDDEPGGRTATRSGKSGKSKKEESKPQIKLVKKILEDPTKEEPVYTDKENNIAYSIFLEHDTTVQVEPGQKVGRGDCVALVPQKDVSSDITRGLPRVVELFEARAPKKPGILAQADGQIFFRRLVRSKELWEIVDAEGNVHEHYVPAGQARLIHSGDQVKKGEAIFDGEEDPREILSLRGKEALTHYIVREVQSVYNSEAVAINDKHIEVIIHQMLQRVEIIDGGDSEFIKDEHASYVRVRKANEELQVEKKKPIVYRPLLLGITKAALKTDSVISAASFQETTKVLTEAALSCVRDSLTGLKESVIVGKLIPAGTGLLYYKQQEHERMLMEERMAAAAEEDDGAPAPDGDGDGAKPAAAGEA